MRITKIVKLISFIICLAMLTVMSISSISAGVLPVGDVDGDNDTDYDDAYLIFNYVTGSGSLSAAQLERADINGDGKVTVVDAAQVFHWVSGVFSTLPYTEKGYGRLVIKSYPAKTEYTEGEALDMTGFSLAVEYQNGQTETAENYSFSGYSSTPGVKIIVVSYGNAKTAFPVTVYPADIVRIEITNPPARLIYQAGQPLDLTGLTVTAVASDGSKKIVTDYTVNGFDSVSGTQVIVINYRMRQASFTVTVYSE